MLTIKIEQINAKETQPVSGSAEGSYPCRFTSALGGGEALLMAGETAPERLVGQEIEVRARSESVTGLRPLPPGEPRTPRLIALPAPGDFLATGQVRSVVWLSDEAEEAVVEVQVGPLLFAVEAGEAGADLEYGEWVQIQLEHLYFHA